MPTSKPPRVTENRPVSTATVMAALITRIARGDFEIKEERTLLTTQYALRRHFSEQRFVTLIRAPFGDVTPLFSKEERRAIFEVTARQWKAQQLEGLSGE